LPPLIVLAVLIGIYLVFGGESGQETGETGTVVTLAYVEWASEVASTHVVAAALERELGVTCNLLPVSAAAMWQAVAEGDADAIVAAWLPRTHGHYLEQVRDNVVDLGPNLDETRIGLVVPAYVDVDSIAGLPAHTEDFGGRIVGIDPGAGIMTATEDAMDAYSLDAYSLSSGSMGAMAAALENAIDEERWVVVTGWRPHWIFARWDLKFLADPKDAYGEGGRIHTIARNGLEDDLPRVYGLLDRFHWSTAQMLQVMEWNREGGDPYANAGRFLDEHPDIVQEWTGEDAN
jgi:glycine betaine/proline transport system substrate-binding protein